MNECCYVKLDDDIRIVGTQTILKEQTKSPSPTKIDRVKKRDKEDLLTAARIEDKEKVGEKP